MQTAPRRCRRARLFQILMKAQQKPTIEDRLNAANERIRAAGGSPASSFPRGSTIEQRMHRAEAEASRLDSRGTGVVEKPVAPTRDSAMSAARAETDLIVRAAKIRAVNAIQHTPL